MKAVMISIRPEWCEKIASGKKTVEVRKSRPKLEPPFKCYIYCTNRRHYVDSKHQFSYPVDSLWLVTHGIFGSPKFLTLKFGCGDIGITHVNGKVIGEFLCNRIEDYSKWEYDIPALYRHINLFACIDYPRLYEYLPNGGGYGWHISDFVLYELPKNITDFRKPCVTPEMPYCPECPAGCEYIRDTEAEFYRTDGECNTEWRCLNYLRRPPQSWCYVMEV